MKLRASIFVAVAILMAAGVAVAQGGECAARHVASSESSERVCESGAGAIRENHGGSGGSDAGGEVWLQAFAGDELVWAFDHAYRGNEQYHLREDFRANGAGGKNVGERSEG